MSVLFLSWTYIPSIAGHVISPSPSLASSQPFAYSVLVNPQRINEWINKSERQTRGLCVRDESRCFISSGCKFINPSERRWETALWVRARGMLSARQIARLIHLFKRLLRFIWCPLRFLKRILLTTPHSCYFKRLEMANQKRDQFLNGVKKKSWVVLTAELHVSHIY